LLDLGIRRLRLVTNNPAKVSGLEEFGLDVVKRVPLVLPSTIYNAQYLETKRNKMGHIL
jgi:3,4-dihydroxy 2-butanone 4-phosphate synthase/GTP cyclohydrolase II